MAKNGLYSQLLDVEKFIKMNDLKECTDPLYINKRAPTPNGVLSYEIFGTSQEERRGRMAYIDLHGHYMHPLAALKLYSYSRTLSDVLYAKGKWSLVDGELVEDEENGNAGPEFLYEIWGKVKVKDKDTVTTKEIQRFYEQGRDKLFLTKYPVIPAYFRDMNTSTGSFSKSSNELNNWYSSIISYTQTLNQYTDTFTFMSRLTQARVQTLLVDIYKKLMVETVKGNPSKFGMLRRYMQGKNVNYSARMVIAAPNQRKESFNDIQVRFGYALIPLTYTMSCFFPFVVFQLKRFFDSEFIQAGKVPVMGPDGKITYTTFTDSFDENTITKMVTRYINSPSSRFDPVQTPPDQNGNVYNMMLTGRFNKQDTTISRRATLTDVLYIATYRATIDKHVFITRYPLDNFNGQFPARVEIATTIKTQPAMIGDTYYQFFPVCEGDPANAFVDTLQFSNTYLGPLGGDYDGDMCSCRPVFTKEANEECERRLRSNAYVVGVEGQLIRNANKDFILTAFNITNTDKKTKLGDVNTTKPKYVI